MAEALPLSPQAPLALSQSEPAEKPRLSSHDRKPKIRGPVLETVLNGLAQYQKICEVVKSINDLHNISISQAAISHFAKQARWQDEIYRRRAALDNKMLEVPISSRWWRQRERNGLFTRTRDIEKMADTARKTLMDAAEEMGHLRRGETQSQPSIVVNVLAALQGSSPEALRIYAETGSLPVAQATALMPGVDAHPAGCRCAECPYAIAASANVITASQVIDTTATVQATGTQVASPAAGSTQAPVIPVAGERGAWPQAEAVQSSGQPVENLLKTYGNPPPEQNRIPSNALTAERLAESTSSSDSPVMSIMSTPEAPTHGPSCPCDVCGLWQTGAVKRRPGRPARYTPGRRKRKRRKTTAG